MREDTKITRKRLILLHTTNFLKALADLKTVYRSKEHFENNLVNLHKAFLKLNNVIRNVHYLSEAVQEECGDFVNYTIGNIKIIKHNIYGVLSVESGNLELNKFLLLKRENGVEESKKFFNFEEAVCDYCGKLGDEIPKNKILDGNIILSFHDRCLNLVQY